MSGLATRTGRPSALAALGATIFLAGLIVSGFAERPRRELVETTRVAAELARSGEFANPFLALRTGATAHVAPVLPFAISPLFRVWGSSKTTHTVLYWAAAAAGAAQAALMPALTAALGLGVLPGLLAAGLALAASPPIAHQWEGSYVALALMVLALLAARGRDEADRLSARDGFAGALFGLVILAHPVALLALAAWLGVALAADGLSRRLVLMALVPLLVVAPWTVRNYAALGGWALVRSNGGTEMRVSFNPCAQVSLMQNMMTGCFRAHHPNRSREQAQRVVDLGELAYNRAQLGDALAWMASEPRRAAELVAGRFASFWLPSPGGDPVHALTVGRQPRVAAGVYLATALSIAGLVVLFRRGRRPGAPLLIGWYALLPLPYYAVQFVGRYRTATLWLTFVLAGIALAAGLEAIRRRRREPVAAQNG